MLTMFGSTIFLDSVMFGKNTRLLAKFSALLTIES